MDIQFFFKKINLSWIRRIEITNLEIYSGKWDSHIKYRKSYGPSFVDLDAYFYTESGAWRYFIFFLVLEGEINLEKNIMIEPLKLNAKFYLKLLLNLFWRKIFNNINSQTFLKIQFRIKFQKFDNSNKKSYYVRSISKVQIINKGDYRDLFLTFVHDLYLLTENYEDLIISSFILFYSICSDESVLKKSIIVLKENKTQWNKDKKIANKKNNSKLTIKIFLKQQIWMIEVILKYWVEVIHIKKKI